MTEARSPLRVLRAALFAAVGVTLAAVGHSSMSGHDLPFGALLLAFVATTAVAWGAGHRRRGVASLTAGLLAMQAALHLWFAGAQSHGGTRHTGGPAPRTHLGTDTRMGTPLSDAGTGTSTGAPSPHAGTPMGSGHSPLGDVLGSSLGMLAVHLLAALVCALWLARGEAAFLRLLAAVDALAFAPLRLLYTAVRLPAPPTRAWRHRRRSSARPPTAVLAHIVSRRGPPVPAILPRHAPMTP